MRVGKRSDGNYPPPHLFSPNPSEKNFEIIILLKIIQRSDKTNLGIDTTPQGLVMPWGIYGSYGRNACISFREKWSSIGRKNSIESSSSLFKSQRRSEGNQSPLHLFFPNLFGANFEIAISLKIGQRSDKKNSGIDLTHHGPGAGVVSYVQGAYTTVLRKGYSYKIQRWLI